MRAVADQKAAEVLMVALLKGALQRAGQLSFVCGGNVLSLPSNRGVVSHLQ